MGMFTGPFPAAAAQLPHDAVWNALLPGVLPQASDTALSAARRRLAREAANIGDWEWDIEADVVTFSREAAVMLGLPLHIPGAQLRENWPRICHPDDLSQIATLKLQAIEGLSPILTEIRISRLGELSEYRRVLLRGHAGATGNGHEGHLRGQIIDVTEQRHAEALFRRVTEALPGMLYLFDLDTDAIEHLNDGYLAFIPDGPSEGVEATRALMALVPLEELPKLSRHRWDCLALKDGEVAECTLRLRLHDGTDRWIHSQRRVIARMADGRVTRLVCSAQDVTAIRQSAETLRQLTQRLLTLQDDERRRIARDLHDSTAQNLLGASLAIRCAEAELGASPHLAEASDLIEDSQHEIRTLSYLLHPPLLDEMGLPAALAWYADSFSKRTGLPLRLDLPGPCASLDRLPLPHEAEMAMFRITQEALANAYRHAGASLVSICLKLEGTSGGGRVVRLRIADDGRGMAPNLNGTGLGLAGMGERMRAVGGSLSIESRVGHGTVVEASRAVSESAP